MPAALQMASTCARSGRPLPSPWSVSRKLTALKRLCENSRKRARQAVDLVEIEQHPEHPIAQPVRARPQAAVHHRADIEGGAQTSCGKLPRWRDGAG